MREKDLILKETLNYFYKKALYHGKENIFKESLIIDNNVVCRFKRLDDYQTKYADSTQNIMRCPNMLGYLEHMYQQLQKIEEVKCHISYLEELLGYYSVQREIEDAKIFLEQLNKQNYYLDLTITFHQDE